MPLPTISQVVRTQLRGLCPSGQVWINTYHFHANGVGVWGSTQIAALDVMIKKLYSTNVYASGIALKSLWSPNTTWTDTVYTPLDGSSASTTITAGVPGTGTAPDLPSEVSPVVTLRTGTRGRSYRGRVYLPPTVTGASTATGFITTAIVNNLVAQFNGWIADLPATGPGYLVVASYHLSIATAVTVSSVDNKFDVQRRRK